MTTIDAARALTPGGGLGPGRLTVIDGRIPAVTPLKRSASNRWLAPRIREAMLRPDKCWPIIVGGHLEGPDLSATAGRRRTESEMMLAASVDFRFASESVERHDENLSKVYQGV